MQFATPGTPLDIDPELPVGWERVATSDGRTVFVDHVHGTHALSLPPGEHVSLPPGGRWEQRIGAGHRLFFVDHDRRVTQWGVPEEFVVPALFLLQWVGRGRVSIGQCRTHFAASRPAN
jgi:hypothetical protein